MTASATEPSEPPRTDRPRRYRRHGSMCETRRDRVTRMGPLFLALAVVALVLVGTTGVTAAAPAGAPSLAGGIIIGSGAALVLVGYLGFLDVWTPAGNGSQVFSQAFYLIFFDLRDTPTNVPYSIHQSNGQYVNSSIYLPAVSEAAVTVSLAADPNWVTTTMSFYNVTGWVGQVATPFSLLPNYLLNIGGLDYFVLLTLSFALVAIGAGVVAGRAAIRRAVFAPTASLFVWGHVYLAVMAGILFVAYQPLEALFAGYTPLLWPWALFPLAFAWSLSLFNRARRVEILVGAQNEEARFGYLRRLVRMGRLSDGRLVYVGPRWSDFWARFWGHHVYADGGAETPAPWLVPVRNEKSPTDGPPFRIFRRTREKVASLRTGKPSGPSEDALTQFPVLSDPQRDAVEFIAWGKAGPIPPIRWPRVKWTRERVKTVVLKNADGSERIERVTRRGLSLPHYEGDSQAAAIPLEDVHSAPAGEAWAYFRSLRDMGRIVSRYKGAAEALQAHIESRVDDRVYAELKSHYALVGRATSGLTEEEADALSKRVDYLARPKRTEGNGA